MDIMKRLSKMVRAHDPPRVSKPATGPTGPMQSMWKTLLKRLKREKKKFIVRSSSMHVHHVGYDEYTYMQNFDQGLQWDSESEPNALSRSFSARYTSFRRSS
ncbi:hypothetical protein L1987_77770 [Smallanthus sonchifolius]|uniref:Uncharacterized protein n=1 Tax=Smallanthus sonchifolius TaxID=185202 RepID=A0ACB8ZAU8_9ASTR|nr:hypothetical protein L1987_77770 [Smallanthus sonchifolius]